MSFFQIWVRDLSGNLSVNFPVDQQEKRAIKLIKLWLPKTFSRLPVDKNYASALQVAIIDINYCSYYFHRTYTYEII